MDAEGNINQLRDKPFTQINSLSRTSIYYNFYIQTKFLVLTSQDAATLKQECIFVVSKLSLSVCKNYNI